MKKRFTIVSNYLFYRCMDVIVINREKPLMPDYGQKIPSDDRIEFP